MMFIGRRVFSKVCMPRGRRTVPNVPQVTSGNHKSNSALQDGDDPMGFCKAIDSEWRVLQKVKVGMYMVDDVDPSDGFTVPCEALVIIEGDFVDVCVGFDIVNRRNNKTGEPEVRVHLNIEHVLLLVSAGDDDLVRNSRSVFRWYLRSTQADEDPETVYVQEPGLSF
jgi:hypothetical protein